MYNFGYLLCNVAIIVRLLILMAINQFHMFVTDMYKKT